MHEGFGPVEPVVGHVEIHRPGLDCIGDVLDRAARETRLGLGDGVQIAAQIGQRVQSAELPVDLIEDPRQPGLGRAGMAFITFGHGALQRLRPHQVVLAHRNVVTAAQQQGKDVDIVGLRLRPVDQKARAGTLAQGVVDILGMVGKHPEGAIAAHHGRGARKGLHQHGGDFLLP